MRSLEFGGCAVYEKSRRRKTLRCVGEAPKAGEAALCGEAFKAEGAALCVAGRLRLVGGCCHLEA
jgi:hypothetical protein